MPESVHLRNGCEMESDLRENDGLQKRVSRRKRPAKEPEENNETHQSQGDSEDPLNEEEVRISFSYRPLELNCHTFL